MLQTEKRNSPPSEFRNTDDCDGEVWGRLPRSCLVSQVFPVRESPLITSPVQGEALDATFISSPSPEFPRHPAMGDSRGGHAKGS